MVNEKTLLQPVSYTVLMAWIEKTANATGQTAEEVEIALEIDYDMPLTEMSVAMLQDATERVSNDLYRQKAKEVLQSESCSV